MTANPNLAASAASDAGTDAVSSSEAPKWEKVLWRRQPFEDNYVPPTFLSELDRLGLWSLILAALPISQHLAAIALLVAVFYRLLVGDLGASQVGWSVTGASLAGWAVSQYGWSRDTKPPPLRGLVLPPLILSLLSPILGTLTSATTSDSIWPLAGGLFFVHLLLADFSTGPDLRLRMQRRKQQEMRDVKRRLGQARPALEEVQEKSLSSSLSLTSALSASIVLASRLATTGQVFALVLLAVALFAGWPSLAKRVREAGKAYSCGLTASMVTLAFSIIPPPSAPIFLSILITANGVGPAMFWYAWKWKIRRGGGWDVAVVRVVRSRPG